jgi:hypothetical protein
MFNVFIDNNPKSRPGLSKTADNHWQCLSSIPFHSNPFQFQQLCHLPSHSRKTGRCRSAELFRRVHDRTAVYIAVAYNEAKGVNIVSETINAVERHAERKGSQNRRINQNIRVKIIQDRREISGY